MMGAILTLEAEADEWNRKTRITFSGPVEIPGVHLEGRGVLPAGSCVFRILDSRTDRRIVQTLNQEETPLYVTILAIPNHRPRAWHYPGQNWGEEFVYPKTTATALARAASTAVLCTPVSLPLEVGADDIS